MLFITKKLIINIWFFFILLFLTVNFSQQTFPQTQGESTFTKTCQACHSIGKGRLVGPDLKDVHNKRTEDWLLKFIKSSQSMVNGGDADAVAIFNEYNKTIMPDQVLTDAEIKEIISYIKYQSESGVITIDISKPIVHSSGVTLDEARDNEFEIGRKLFSGENHLTNKGPACISCHNVVNDELISGGLLAIDLTNAFARLTGPGIHNIISNPPFPVMKTAYANHPVTGDEAFYLTAFLKNSDFVSSIQEPNIPQQNFLYSGIIGGVVLFGLYGGIWWNRKRKAVNHKIYKRQITSY